MPYEGRVFSNTVVVKVSRIINGTVMPIRRGAVGWCWEHGLRLQALARASERLAPSASRSNACDRQRGSGHLASQNGQRHVSEESFLKDEPGGKPKMGRGVCEPAPEPHLYREGLWRKAKVRTVLGTSDRTGS
jgi:hypothetical protein